MNKFNERKRLFTLKKKPPTKILDFIKHINLQVNK